MIRVLSQAPRQYISTLIFTLFSPIKEISLPFVIFGQLSVSVFSYKILFGKKWYYSGENVQQTIYCRLHELPSQINFVKFICILYTFLFCSSFDRKSVWLSNCVLYSNILRTMSIFLVQLLSIVRMKD